MAFGYPLWGTYGGTFRSFLCFFCISRVRKDPTRFINSINSCWAREAVIKIAFHFDQAKTDRHRMGTNWARAGHNFFLLQSKIPALRDKAR